MLKPDAALRKDQTNGAGKTTLEHRHFAFIAATLASMKPAQVEDDHVHSFWEGTTQRFADACAHTNPRFDRARFLSACGVGE